MLLTGATGYIGTGVRRALRASGHDLVAVARPESAGTLADKGIEVRVGDIADTSWLVEQLREVDAAVHAASPGDATSGEFDSRMVDGVVLAFAGTEKRYVHTGGLWSWGPSDRIVETDLMDTPRIAQWRVDIERRVLSSEVRATVVSPGTVYGAGGGLTRLVLEPGADGEFRLIGDGSQRWSLIHRDDLGRLYVAILESERLHERVIGVSGEVMSVREMAVLVARGCDVVAETADETRARFGRSLGEALLMDQRAIPARARELPWLPSHATLRDSLSAFASAPPEPGVNGDDGASELLHGSPAGFWCR